MLLTEYDEVKTMELFKEEGREEGWKEGVLDILIQLVKEGVLSKKMAAEKAEMTAAEFEKEMEEAGKKSPSSGSKTDR